MYLGVFDLFKIGIGPSSSHTVGPMRAARRFLQELEPMDLLAVTRVSVTLYGSLAHTGRGHATDRAICLGLLGLTADEVTAQQIATSIEQIRSSVSINLLNQRSIRFDLNEDIIFERTEQFQAHPNAMMFQAFGAGGKVLADRVYYSVGGGFVVDEVEFVLDGDTGMGPLVPCDFRSMAELLVKASRRGDRMADVLWRNEEAIRPRADVEKYLDYVIDTMFSCIDRGIDTEGMLPGGLHVRRRAAALAGKLRETPTGVFSDEGTGWLNVYAIAVNEENAAGGRVVTAPTNGAAGVVPSVLRYYMNFRGGTREGAHEFLLVGAAIGALCKMNASISGAEVGCQGEVGSAAAMAAAGLASALGASNDQIENAAEIALEHHLGMTCDPVGGLVQIPCIERNAMGAVKAVNATALALSAEGEHRISLDSAIETMKRTGADMQSKYKETSLGGLALARVNC